MMGAMVTKMPITAGGLGKLEQELRKLKHEDRPNVIEAISEARAHGDLSENAEYHAAREKQSFIEGRIKELEDKISRAEVIDISKLSGDTVKFGATVEIVDEDDNTVTYQIVGVEEADLNQCRISVTSPLSKALIGKEVGDVVEVAAPGGSKSYEIEKVTYQ